MGNLKIRKAAGRDEVIGETIKSECKLVADWI